MDTDSAAQTIWDYMLLHHPLKKADVLMVLGNRDTRVAEYTAQLYHAGWAPVILCAGSGTIHNQYWGQSRLIHRMCSIILPLCHASHESMLEGKYIT
ncbi:MAG: hypothetical protein KBD24_01125 [Candidatus Pacebacteria bacterium]|nr:hypothetical protein [Candidatus Paceibacterota bacterium]